MRVRSIVATGEEGATAGVVDGGAPALTHAVNNNVAGRTEQRVMASEGLIILPGKTG
jgi:hypothetical protein